MGQHLSICIGREIPIAVADELIFERLIILDDAVVNQSQPARRVEVRMRVSVGWFAVRGPARVADTEGPSRRPFRHELAELRNPAGAFARLDFIAVDYRNAGRVVAAIFQAPQPIEKDGRGLGTTDVTDNATHKEDRDIKR